MSSYSYYKHTRTESVDLPYSFRCEQCTMDSGIRKVTVTGTGVKDNHSKQLNEKDEVKVREQAHKDLVKRIKKVHRDAVERQVFSTDFKDECPHCHKPQSWGVSGLKKKMFETPIVIFGAGLFFAVACLAGRYSGMEYLTLPVAAGIAAAGLAGAVISLLWNVMQIKRKSAKTSSGMQRNLPVIEWSGVQNLLDEP